MTIEQVRNLLRAACAKAGTQAIWAKSAGVSTAYVSDVLTGKRNPGRKMLAALGVTIKVSYRRDK